MQSAAPFRPGGPSSLLKNVNGRDHNVHTWKRENGRPGRSLSVSRVSNVQIQRSFITLLEKEIVFLASLFLLV